MPPATEKLNDRQHHNVYGTMVILTFILLVAACLILNDDLTKTYAWNEQNHPMSGVEFTISEINKEPTKHPNTFCVTERDLDLYKKIQERMKNRGESTGELAKNFAWPEGYKPLDTPVRGGADNLSGIPEEARQALLKDYQPGGGDASVPPTGAAPAPAPAPEAKPAETPAAAPAAAPATNP